MASGDPVDLQRDKRWPVYTEHRVEVEFKLKPDEDNFDGFDESEEELMPKGVVYYYENGGKVADSESD
jgi:hypothetical protein